MQDWVAMMIFFTCLLFLLLSYLFYIEVQAEIKPIDGVTLCPTNQCAIGADGIKRCPPSGQRITTNPGEECTEAYGCTANNFPYALWPDGSVHPGVCPANLACNCVTAPRCGDYVASAWNVGPQSNILTSRGIDRQVLNQVTPPPTSLPPNTYCAIPPNWTMYGSPGCPTDGKFDLDTLQACMNDDRACQAGTLAFVPENLNDVYRSPMLVPVACVYGQRGTCRNKLRVWDNQRGELVCVDRIKS